MINENYFFTIIHEWNEEIPKNNNNVSLSNTLYTFSLFDFYF